MQNFEMKMCLICMKMNLHFDMNDSARRLVDNSEKVYRALIRLKLTT